MAQKSSELEQYLQRVRELEDMYLKLQEALEDERQARQDEETVRKLQARWRLLCSPRPHWLCLLWVLTLADVRRLWMSGWLLGYRNLCWGSREGTVPESTVLAALAAMCLLYSRMSISQISFGRNLVSSPSPDLSNLGAEAELPQAWHGRGFVDQEGMHTFCLAVWDWHRFFRSYYLKSRF